MRSIGAAWSRLVRPEGDAGFDPRNDDGKAFLVGRWVSCGPTGSVEAIEFGANGRFRHLVKDVSGNYGPISGNPAASRGSYSLLAGNAQLNLRDDLTLDWITDRGVRAEGAAAFIDTVPTMEAMRITSSKALLPDGIYVRSAPSVMNGWDNLPSLYAKTCSLFGVWDTDANGTPAATYSFDALGNFVAFAGVGANVCATYPCAGSDCPTGRMYGTYALGPGAFMLTQNVGMGFCSFWFSAGYPITFNSDCTRATIGAGVFDNCTGGRQYLNQPTTLVKRP